MISLRLTKDPFNSNKQRDDSVDENYGRQFSQIVLTTGVKEQIATNSTDLDTFRYSMMSIFSKIESDKNSTTNDQNNIEENDNFVSG
jgi:hypothetical protein